MATASRIHLNHALSTWEVARDRVDAGLPYRAGLTYQKALNHMLLGFCQSHGDPAGERVAILHGMAVIGREGVPVIELRSRKYAVIHAHTTLAAAQLADPTGGSPAQIPEALARGESGGLDLQDGSAIDTDVLIAGAAQSRLLLAELIGRHPQLFRPRENRWPISDLNFGGFGRTRRHFHRAILPSCAGLDRNAEAVRLAEEAAAIYRALSQTLTVYREPYLAATKIRAKLR